MDYTEEKYVWILGFENKYSVFIGFDHFRKMSKTYESFDKEKIMELGNKMANQHKIELIISIL